jgi:Zn-dependent protease
MWSWSLGRIAGIDLKVHASFLLVLLLGAAQWRSFGVDGALFGALLMALTFASVLLHELGHSLVALAFKIPVKDITLYPIGGVARLTARPKTPGQEFLIALAGPAVNVLLVVLIGGLGVWWFGGDELWSAMQTAYQREPDLTSLVALLVMSNAGLALFNMVPALPMDGGRVLRAVLAMRMDYVRATNIAASIGQGMAWVFGFIGLFTNPFLMFIALFVWMGAAQEASQAQMKSALAGLPVSRVMMTDFRTLAPEDPLARAVEHVLSGCQQDFPVLDGGRVVGVLTRGDLLTGLAKLGQLAPVAEVMQRNVCTAEAGEMIESVLSRLQQGDCRVLPVIRHGELAGIVTTENLGEYMMIQAALGEVARSQPVKPPPSASQQASWLS